MKIKYKLFFLLLLITILISVTIIMQAYAKYKASLDGSVNASIARWSIALNNTDVMANSNLSSSVTPVFPGSTHIANDIVAPSAEGYFDLALDYTNVDVSFSYEISVASSSSSTVSDFIPIAYSIDSGTRTAYNGDLTGTVLLTDVARTTTIRIYVQWIDDSVALMNNAEDTNAILAEGFPSVDVDISFTQITQTP